MANTATLQQIKDAHAQVRSGADYPKYAHALKQMGIANYQTFLNDGRTHFNTANGDNIVWPAKHEIITIADTANGELLRKHIQEHQQGLSDYPTVRLQCASDGVEMWQVDLHKMTCTYFDKAGNAMLVESIPG